MATAPTHHGRGSSRVRIHQDQCDQAGQPEPSRQPGAGSLPIAGVTGARAPPRRRPGGRGPQLAGAPGWLRLISPIVVLALWQIVGS